MKVTIVHPPKEADGAKVLTVFRHVFPTPGTYHVHAEHGCESGGDLTKAAPVGDAPEGSFETWFLQALYERTRAHFVSAELAIWEVLDELLAAHDVHAPSELDLWDLNRALFDVSVASTSRMVGIRVPGEVSARLTAIGFTPPEVLDFPGLAYRMGRIYEALQQRRPLEWAELVERAKSFPLSPAEQAAVQYVRTQAGVWLKPIFDATGHAWTADRELVPLRRIASGALESRKGARAAARELANSQRARGIVRDAERVIRTELADARGQGVWRAEIAGLADDALVFRQTSTAPCKVCLRMWKNPDGTPRLYRKAELEAFDRLGANSGPQDSWRPRIGAVHPNCVCGPVTKYHEAMAPIFGARAPEYAQLMQRLKVFPEAA